MYLQQKTWKQNEPFIQWDYVHSINEDVWKLGCDVAGGSRFGPRESPGTRLSAKAFPHRTVTRYAKAGVRKLRRHCAALLP